MKIHAFRLQKGQELKSELVKYVEDSGIKAGFVITCVASFSSTRLRMAGAKPGKQDFKTIEGLVELVSIVGTFSVDGSHIHISVSDKQGNVFGGHLKEAIVETTAEVIIGEDDKAIYRRLFDDKTGFKEFSVH